MGLAFLIWLFSGWAVIGGTMFLHVPPVLAELLPCGDLYPDGGKVGRCIVLKKEILDLTNKINKANSTEHDIKGRIGKEEGEIDSSRFNSRIYMVGETIKIADQLVGGTCSTLASVSKHPVAATCQVTREIVQTLYTLKDCVSERPRDCVSVIGKILKLGYRYDNRLTELAVASAALDASARGYSGNYGQSGLAVCQMVATGVKTGRMNMLCGLSKQALVIRQHVENIQNQLRDQDRTEFQIGSSIKSEKNSLERVQRLRAKWEMELTRLHQRLHALHASGSIDTEEAAETTASQDNAMEADYASEDHEDVPLLGEFSSGDEPPNSSRQEGPGADFVEMNPGDCVGECGPDPFVEIPGDPNYGPYDDEEDPVSRQEYSEEPQNPVTNSGAGASASLIEPTVCQDIGDSCITFSEDGLAMRLSGCGSDYQPAPENCHCNTTCQVGGDGEVDLDAMFDEDDSGSEEDRIFAQFKEEAGNALSELIENPTPDDYESALDEDEADGMKSADYLAMLKGLRGGVRAAGELRRSSRRNSSGGNCPQTLAHLASRLRSRDPQMKAALNTPVKTMIADAGGSASAITAIRAQIQVYRDNLREVQSSGKNYGSGRGKYLALMQDGIMVNEALIDAIECHSGNRSGSSVVTHNPQSQMRNSPKKKRCRVPPALGELSVKNAQLSSDTSISSDERWKRIQGNVQVSMGILQANGITPEEWQRFERGGPCPRSLMTH